MLHFPHTEQSRLYVQDFLHHIMSYGIERRNIPHDDTDRDEFVRYLSHLGPFFTDIGTGTIFLEVMNEHTKRSTDCISIISPIAESSFMPENVLSKSTSGREQSLAIILVWDAMVFFRCNICLAVATIICPVILSVEEATLCLAVLTSSFARAEETYGMPATEDALALETLRVF